MWLSVQFIGQAAFCASEVDNIILIFSNSKNIIVIKY